MTIIHFNSHTREGVTLSFSETTFVTNDFNSHTREGVTTTFRPAL